MINPKYKDRLFRLLFGDEQNKENILDLYNALCNTNHTNIDDIQIYTIDDVLYISMKNDVSILVDSYLCLWEQQSTFNPNMPVRGLMYYGKMYSKYISGNHLNLYGKKLLKLPTPRYTVFYNGGEEYPAIIDLKLSDSLSKPDSTHDFEWTAHMINLNAGKNDQLLNQCKPLKDYMIIINLIRANLDNGMDISSAVNVAVSTCISNNVLAEFLTKHRAEVIEMCITEYDETAFANGLRSEGKQEMAINMYKGGMSIDKIAQFAEVSENTVREWLKDSEQYKLMFKQ